MIVVDAVASSNDGSTIMSAVGTDRTLAALTVDDDPTLLDAVLAFLDARWQVLVRAPRRKRHALLRRWLLAVIGTVAALVLARWSIKGALKSRREGTAKYAAPSWAFSHNNEMQGDGALDRAVKLGFGAVEVDVWLAPRAGLGSLARRDVDSGPAPSTVAGPLLRDANAHGPGFNLDVVDDGWTLFVGHTARDAVHGRTLEDAYLDPLYRRLDLLGSQRNGTGNSIRGLFPHRPEAELMLVLDIKTDGDAAWPYLVSLLAPLASRGYLTTYDARTSTWTRGPLLVVGTGSTPLSRVYAQTPRSIFFDAPLRDIARPVVVCTPVGPEVVQFDRTLAPLASARLPVWFHAAALLRLPRPFNPAIELAASLAHEARARGAEPRWYAVARPGALRWLRRRVWGLLDQAGVRWIGGDALDETRAWVGKREIRERVRDAKKAARGE
ncbi:Altered inheritance of mitochondria protein 6 [Cryptotrichosporon argae]